MRSMDSCAIRFDLRPVKALSFAIALFLAGCASSGDLEKTRQEQAQAKAKMNAELQQERQLTTSIQQESAAKRAEAEKLAQALGGKGKPQTKALGAGAGDGSDTTLKITNATANPVPVMITLGAGYAINNIDQLPGSWGVVQDPVGIQGLSGIFMLAGSSSVSYNSSTSSFSGNVAFGPTSWGRGCGNSAAGACYPNATNLAEFTLNFSGGMETVDISDVNGVNAKITVNFTPQGSGNWNDGPKDQHWANQNVTQIAANQSIAKWTSPFPPGVYGWQATTCTGNSGYPNPQSGCAAPEDTPSASQLQTNPQCNIQRAVGTSGGTVEVVFGGFTDKKSAPQTGCMAVYTISPASGSLSGGTTVTMTGWGLLQVPGVTFQGATASIVSQTDTTLVVKTPPCNFCNGNPGYSNVMLNGSYIVPNNAAGWGAPGAYKYTSP